MTGSPLTGHPIALARWGPLREDERIQDLRHCEESDQAIQFFGVPDCSRSLSSRRTTYAAAATGVPLKESPSRPAEIFTASPSLILPERMSSASGSCTDFWITRFNGRAP